MYRETNEYKNFLLENPRECLQVIQNEALSRNYLVLGIWKKYLDKSDECDVLTYVCTEYTCIRCSEMLVDSRQFSRITWCFVSMWNKVSFLAHPSNHAGWEIMPPWCKIYFSTQKMGLLLLMHSREGSRPNQLFVCLFEKRTSTVLTNDFGIHTFYFSLGDSTDIEILFLVIPRPQVSSNQYSFYKSQVFTIVFLKCLWKFSSHFLLITEILWYNFDTDFLYSQIFNKHQSQVSIQKF